MTTDIEKVLLLIVITVFAVEISRHDDNFRTAGYVIRDSVVLSKVEGRIRGRVIKLWF